MGYPKRMKKSILCPIDFSKSSVNALQYAIELAKKEHSGITVLYSFRLIQPKNGEGVVSFRKKMEKTALEKFTGLEKYFETDKQVDHRFLVEIGFFSDSIASQVRKNAISKVVIGNDMYPLINDHIIGHHQPMTSYLNSLRIPLIVVPENP
jgi:nucleotide-binding universal stress UspA family protein